MLRLGRKLARRNGDIRIGSGTARVARKRKRLSLEAARRMCVATNTPFRARRRGNGGLSPVRRVPLRRNPTDHARSGERRTVARDEERDQDYQEPGKRDVLRRELSSGHNLMLASTPDSPLIEIN